MGGARGREAGTYAPDMPVPRPVLLEQPPADAPVADLQSLADAASRARGDLPAALALATEHADAFPLPGSGDTRRLWESLATVASVDLTVARTLEPHLDAEAVLTQAGLAGLWSSGTWGVYAAEGPGPRLEARDEERPHPPRRAQAVVLARRLAQPRPRHRLVRSERPGACMPSSWATRASWSGTPPGSPAASPTCRAARSPSPASRPRPWAGPAGISTAPASPGAASGSPRSGSAGRSASPDACSTQAAERELDQIGQMHLGAVDAAIVTARTVLRDAAAQVDAGLAEGPAGAVLALRCRQVVAAAAERVLERVDHALGPAPLALEREHAARVADLRLYLRQEHAERDQAALGRALRGDRARDAAVVTGPAPAFTHHDGARPSPGGRAPASGPTSSRSPTSAAPALSRVVVVAAHPDDETLGAGGLIRVAADRGLDVHLVLLTAGEASHPDSPTHTPDRLAALRVEREPTDALAALAPVARLTVVGIADGGVEQAHATALEAVVDAVGEHGGATLVVAPWRHDGHPDHEAAGHVAALAAARTDATLVEYPIWLWHWGTEERRPVGPDAPARRSRRTWPTPSGPPSTCTRPRCGPCLTDRATRCCSTPGVVDHFRRDWEVFLTAEDEARRRRLRAAAPGGAGPLGRADPLVRAAQARRHPGRPPPPALPPGPRGRLLGRAARDRPRRAVRRARRRSTGARPPWIAARRRWPTSRTPAPSRPPCRHSGRRASSTSSSSRRSATSSARASSPGSSAGSATASPPTGCCSCATGATRSRAGRSAATASTSSWASRSTGRLLVQHVEADFRLDVWGRDPADGA